jgi:hypothetical protein
VVLCEAVRRTRSRAGRNYALDLIDVRDPSRRGEVGDHDRDRHLPRQQPRRTATRRRPPPLLRACGHEYDGHRLDPCPACGDNGIGVAPADELAIVDWTA